MMSFLKTQEKLDNLENGISQYLAKKVDAGMDGLSMSSFCSGCHRYNISKNMKK